MAIDSNKKDECKQGGVKQENRQKRWERRCVVVVSHASGQNKTKGTGRVGKVG